MCWRTFLFVVLVLALANGLQGDENEIKGNKNLKETAKLIYTKSRLPGEFKNIYTKIANDVYEYKQDNEDKQVALPLPGLLPGVFAGVPPGLIKKKLGFILASTLGKVGALKAVTLVVGLAKHLAGKFGFKNKEFIGRCLGVARRLKFVLPLIIFKLGVILTTLVFLTIFALKGLGIGVLLLIMNISKILAKLFAFKVGHFDLGGHGKHEGGVHYHIHAKGGHSPPSHYSHYPPPKWEDEYTTGYTWKDRLSDRLGSLSTIEEKQELLDLYQRLGMARSNQQRSLWQNIDIPIHNIS